MYAKSSNLNAIITEFSTALKEFKADSNKKFQEIQNIANAVKWDGNEATKFKQTIQTSANSVAQTLKKTDELTKKLDEKALQWAQIMNKFKALK